VLELEYNSKSEIPAGYEGHYAEKDGKWGLLQAGQIKTATDVTNVQEALRREREDHSSTKIKLVPFKDIDPLTVREQLDSITELRIAAEGNMDETKIKAIADARVATATAKMQRDLDAANTAHDTVKTAFNALQVTDTARKVTDHAREVGTKGKLNETGMQSLLMMAPHMLETNAAGELVTKANAIPGSSVVAGLPLEVALTQLQSSFPAWWPDSEGANSRDGKGGGGGGTNPFTAKHWNLTEQGKMVTEDASGAAKMAQAAGVAIGATQPAKATA
jgi:hypothetical protein